MASFNGLWLPNSDSSNATPGAEDMYKVGNSQVVQAARIENSFLPRLVENNTAMFTSDGHVYKDVDFTVLGGIGVQTHKRNDRFSGMNVNQLQRQVSLDDRPVSNTIEQEEITKQFDQVPTDVAMLQRQGAGHAEWLEVEVMKAIADASAYTNPASADDNEFLVGGGDIAIGATRNEAQALAVLGAIETASIAWGKKMVPAAGRWCIVSPETYWNIVKLDQFDTAVTQIAGGIYGNVDLAGDKVNFSEYLDYQMPLRYRGVNIIGHNMIDATYNIHTKGLQSSDHVIDSDHNNRGSTYNSSGDFSGVEGLLFQSSAVGLADVMSMMVMQEKVPLSTNVATTTLSWIGLGTLRPEAAYVLDKS